MGSTQYLIQILQLYQDHPHIHGKHNFADVIVALAVGSPPYTWGAPVCVIIRIHVIRITPIYMGSTIAAKF